MDCRGGSSARRWLYRGVPRAPWRSATVQRHARSAGPASAPRRAADDPVARRRSPPTDDAGVCRAARPSPALRAPLDQLQGPLRRHANGADSRFSRRRPVDRVVRGGQLRRSPAPEARRALCDAPVGRGGNWSDDDTIVFTRRSEFRADACCAAGGTAAGFGAPWHGGMRPAAAAGAARFAKAAWYTRAAATRTADAANARRGAAVGRDAQDRPPRGLRRPVRGEAAPVDMQHGTLFVVRFDLDRLETIGEAVRRWRRSLATGHRWRAGGVLRDGTGLRARVDDVGSDQSMGDARRQDLVSGRRSRLGESSSR